jgi:hypothetical protein
MNFNKNDKSRRFELTLKGKTAYIDFYEVDTSKIYLTHIEVPDDLEGSGIGSELTKKTMEYIDNEDLSLVPKCPFINSYIKNHPKYRRLLDESVKL